MCLIQRKWYNGLNTCAWSKENNEAKIKLQTTKKFWHIFSTNFDKTFANLWNTGQSQDTDSQRRGIIICSNGVHLETKHGTHIEQISYIEIWQSLAYNVPQIVWGTWKPQTPNVPQFVCPTPIWGITQHTHPTLHKIYIMHH